MRRAIAAAGLLTVLLAQGAAAAPDNPVRDLLPQTLGLDLSGSIQPLQQEQSSGSKLTVTISSDVLFEFDKAALTPEAVSHLAALTPRLKGGSVQVTGYTDALGTAAYNLGMSRQRAAAVKAELQRLGVGQVTARGLGEANPVAPNKINDKDDPAGRAKNRRVEIVVQK
jgi:outer membrane protein OmpA-like peptidoglycan-associated protein